MGHPSTQAMPSPWGQAAQHSHRLLLQSAWQTTGHRLAASGGETTPCIALQRAPGQAGRAGLR